jgi:PAS domain S-box-containing protein
LLVEDNNTDAKLLIMALRKTHPHLEFERVDTEDAMRAALRNSKWDVIISDWSMPSFNALNALAVLQDTGMDLPFIIASGTIGEEAAVDAMRAGAHDYVLKDKLARLAPAVEREIRECRMREAHRRQEARFRALIERSSEGIIITNVDGAWVYVSPAASAIFGRSSDDLTGKSILDFTIAEDRDAVMRAMSQVRSESSTSLEFRVVSAEGSLRWVSATSTNHLVDPTLRAIVTNIRDITDRKSTAATLRKTEEHLRQAQKMEAVGRLAGGIAHDFNNVLSVILSYSEMLVAELKVGDPMRDDLEEIRRAGKRAAALTRHLLMFSRQQVLEPRVLDLSELLAGMDKMLQRLLGEDVDLIFSRAPGLGKIHADASGVEQVIMNLAVNARDAMPTGGKLTIETANVVVSEENMRALGCTTSGPHVLLTVCDTGVGMDEATQSRIFEPFFTTKARDKGTGLGLSTVFGIVQQSGGCVSVSSKLGQGTTFKIYLPCKDGAAHVERLVGAPTTGDGTETILLVEDEDQVRTVARGILQRHGYHVLDARNAGEALLLCEKHAGQIHLLLSDVVMPQMSGPELANRLGALRPTMKVLFMSGYTDDSIVRHGALTSNIAFLQKPLTPSSLTRRVRDVLDEARS